MDIQDELQTLYTSGTVFHAFLGQKLNDWKATANLVKTIAENYRLPYYTISPTYSICKNHGYINGEVYVCPECGEHTEVYSRITGYYRPVQNWNDGKAEEFKDRQVYDMSKSHLKKHCVCEEKAKEQNKATNLNEILLFATKTCPNCKMAKAILDRAGVKYTVIDAEENKELVAKFGVKKAPTLLVPHQDGFDVYDTAGAVYRVVEGWKKGA